MSTYVNFKHGEEPTSQNSSSLEPLETNESARWMETSSQRRLHSRWKTEREFVIQSLLDGKNRVLWKRAGKMEGCCAFPGVGKDSKNRPILFLHRCKDRMCPRCQAQRGRVATEKISGFVRGMNAARFITFTLKHRNASLAQEIKRCAAAFRLLRKEPLWKLNVLSGIWALEITRNGQTGLWHVHLHIIADGRYMPHGQLVELWKKVTGDSYVVDIRAVVDRNRAASYVARYVSKPADVTSWPKAAVREYAESLHGCRMLHTFGKLHGVVVDPGEKEAENKGITEVCSLRRLSYRASIGDVNADRACEILARCGNVWRMALGMMPLQPHTPSATVLDWEIEFALQTATKIGDESSIIPEPPRPVEIEKSPQPPPSQLDLLDVAPYAGHHV